MKEMSKAFHNNIFLIRFLTIQHKSLDKNILFNIRKLSRIPIIGVSTLHTSDPWSVCTLHLAYSKCYELRIASYYLL